MQTLIPTQLFVGPYDQVQAAVQLFLQTSFCSLTSKNSPQAECFCTPCRQIKNRQHQLVLWLAPEHDYKIDDLEIIFEKIHLALDTEQAFYFVLEKAETLSTACANKLLKIMEEPPQGYNFILMTTNEESLLATIRSRCHVVHVGGQTKEALHPFLNYFCSTTPADPFDFEQALRQYHFSDSQSTQLLDDLLHYFTAKMIALHTDNYTENQINNNENSFATRPNVHTHEKKQLAQIITFLKEQLRRPPQSGSSELFWKNLYLNFPQS